MTEIILWISLGAIVYTYVGFPLLLLARGAWQRRPVIKAGVTPRISFIIVAHNEADSIQAKLENAYALDYPSEKLEVIVASDGSDDGTNELVDRFTSRGLRLLQLPRSGKIPALNAAAAVASGDVLVFSDANSMYATDALRKLIAPFADPAVGGVGGNQRYLPGSNGAVAGFGERIYWRYDRFLKTMQSRAGNMTSATGAIHAVRRVLFRPVPLGVSDDFMISTRAIAQGYRLVFEPDAVAFETVAPTDGAEFNRKLRIMVRGLRSLWAARGLFNPLRHGFYSFQLLSHKFLRWSVGWLLLVVLATSISLYGAGPVYRCLVQAEVAFYGCAVSAWVLRDTAVARTKFFKLLALPFYFCLVNWAAVRAWLEVFRGKRVDVWDSRREVQGGSMALSARELR